MAQSTENARASAWQRWLNHPERSRLRHVFFQIHLSVGALLSLYVLVISLSGSLLVFRNQLSGTFPIQWLVNFHSNLLSGTSGRTLNGIGAICVALLGLTGAIIWWPGIKHWRRSLTVSWGAQFPRIMWDLHSAAGFWCLLPVLWWAISATYFAFPRAFDALLLLDPKDRFTDQALAWLSQLHFGRFNLFTQAIWTILGLAPAILAFSGVFICCRRMIYQKPSNPKAESNAD